MVGHENQEDEEAVLQVGWTRVGGGLASPHLFAWGGDKPRPYAVPSTFETTL